MSFAKLLAKLAGLAGVNRQPGERPYLCPVCGKSVAGFAPLPDFYAENLRMHGAAVDFDNVETLNWRAYSCNECGASDRDRLYALYLAQRLAGREIPAGYMLVQFAPSAPLSRFIRQFAGVNYRTADIAMDGVDDLVDIMDLGVYPDGFADFFICSHVLEHVSDDHRALGELFRILKPGGEGIVMVPLQLFVEAIDEDPSETDEAERWRRFGQDDHIRRYSRQGFLDRVRGAGFTVRRLGIDHFGADLFEKCAITPQSILYVVEKNA